MSSSEAQAAPTVPAMAAPKCGLVAYLQVDGAIAAARFYEKAFGAEIAAMHAPDEQGRTMHVHLYINGASLMLADFYPDHGQPKVPHQGFSLALMVTDIEKRFQRAVDAGCTATLPVQKMFWGDLYGQLKDPYGVDWAMNQGA
ncbi:MAG TPA: glyoxalase/bleomycin resistance/extradiol dioxygenase family protein [Phenylobacterium sp.]|uniref:VOC family protein n=1 Tax=Phenylobacterium sp. TaxID=1871053 RepID=UPI002B488C20|nr:glyoxalase/bleomycin resistance/extradiol dioxygenase family protein [Phenylobacterium sp.]HKR88066.1 glyoxalase/bleomycin resistance/extradiol dioxygenase family protein [Phenylobacterium sp.]